jgi:hypothetical protein
MEPKPLTGGKTTNMAHVNSGRQVVFDAMVSEFAHNAYVNRSKDLSLYAPSVSIQTQNLI